MGYTEDWPCACTFARYRGNQTIESFRVFIDRTVVYDICFFLYKRYLQTRPLEDIAFCFRWLTCGSCLMYPHLPEQIIRQFKFLQTIPRPPFLSAPSTVCNKDLYVILDDFYNHPVPVEARSMPTLDPWSYAQSYINWLYLVSHPYMTLGVAETSPRSAHQEIL